MKYILSLIVVILISGCNKSYKQYQTLKKLNKYPKEDVAVMYQDENINTVEHIIYYKTTLEIDGISHEYIRIDGYRRCALTHYPECKYCKCKGRD